MRQLQYSKLQFCDCRGPKDPGPQPSLRKAKTLLKQLGFDDEMQKRLAACVDATGVSARYLVQQSARAVVEAIEHDGYAIALPLEITVKRI